MPELSKLIERMLAKEPEARGTAREVAEAAEAAAEHARPEANVPFLDLEWPEAEVHAAPVRVRTEPRASPWGSRIRAAAIVGGFVLLFVAMVWRAPTPQAEVPRVAQAEVLGAESAPDAGTRGLGDDALTARVDSQGEPVAPESVSRDIPPQPRPGQQRPPCQRRGEVVINGGCWVLLANIEPPCGEGEYEWQGSCYRPAQGQSRPPTSKKPQ